MNPLPRCGADAYSTTFVYDADGNQVSSEVPAGDVTTNTWDVRNQLTQVELPSLTVLTYTYDADDRRVSRDDGVDEQRYVHDGRNILIETDDLGVVTAENTFEPIEHGKLISQYDGTESHWHAYDALGSTDRLTDSAEVVSDSYVYQAFGEIKSSSGVTENLYTWVGELSYRAEPEFGESDSRYLLDRRSFGAASGRFLSQDPIGFEAGDENLYRYVGNDVVGEVDPSGLEPSGLRIKTRKTGNRDVRTVEVMSRSDSTQSTRVGTLHLKSRTVTKVVPGGRQLRIPYKVLYDAVHRDRGGSTSFFGSLFTKRSKYVRADWTQEEWNQWFGRQTQVKVRKIRDEDESAIRAFRRGELQDPEKFARTYRNAIEELQRIPNPLGSAVAGVLKIIGGKELEEYGANPPGVVDDDPANRIIDGVGKYVRPAIQGAGLLEQAVQSPDLGEFVKQQLQQKAEQALMDAAIQELRNQIESLPNTVDDELSRIPKEKFAEREPLLQEKFQLEVAHQIGHFLIDNLPKFKAGQVDGGAINKFLDDLNAAFKAEDERIEKAIVQAGKAQAKARRRGVDDKLAHARFVFQIREHQGRVRQWRRKIPQNQGQGDWIQLSVALAALVGAVVVQEGEDEEEREEKAEQEEVAPGEDVAPKGGPGAQRWMNKTKNNGEPYAKPGPRPDGPHNDKIDDIIEQQLADGHEHIGGGLYRDVRELTIRTPGGYKPTRRPDASFIHKDTGEIFHYNVGRKNVRAGSELDNIDPIIREREALEDLRGAGESVFFVPYTP